MSSSLKRSRSPLAEGTAAALLLGALLSSLALQACNRGEREKSLSPPTCSKTSNGMVAVKGGSFRMGADDTYTEEGPSRLVTVKDFWIDRYELTNAEFAKFVDATAYVTDAERDRQPDGPGSAMFRVPTDDNPNWWAWSPGTSWKTPEGPGSKLNGRAQQPVVHITIRDAEAYAKWAGKRLLTEEEWEYAARGGLHEKRFSWGDEARPNGKHMANHYQGAFPARDTGDDGYISRAPVGCFPPNGFGLYDMTGNVWELVNAEGRVKKGATIIKGGSYLCADNYCLRYRPASRQLQETDLGTNHVGVRFARDEAPIP
jgi:formylglycine-generating enzyme